MGTSNTQISRIEGGRHALHEATHHRALRAMAAVPLVGDEVPERVADPLGVSSSPSRRRAATAQGFCARLGRIS